jgi:hypothetical protein
VSSLVSAESRQLESPCHKPNPPRIHIHYLIRLIKILPRRQGTPDSRHSRQQTVTTQPLRNTLLVRHLRSICPISPITNLAPDSLPQPPRCYRMMSNTPMRFALAYFISAVYSPLQRITAVSSYYKGARRDCSLTIV